MLGFIIAVVLVGYFAVLAGLFRYWINRENVAGLVLFLLWLIGGVGFTINLAREENKKGPCLQWENGMSYNAATKTMMPYKRCSERGEWVEEDT